MTIPTPGTNSFASAFNTDESEGGGGGDIFGSFCVENVSKQEANWPEPARTSLNRANPAKNVNINREGLQK